MACLVPPVLAAIACLWIVFTADDGQSYEGCSQFLVTLLKIMVIFSVVSSLCILVAPVAEK